MSAGAFTIGEAAHAAGVTVYAVRHYEELGLVAPSHRVGGKRRFAPSSIRRLSLIRSARQAGLSLDRVRVLLDEEQDWRQVLAEHREELRRQRDELDRLLAALEVNGRCQCRHPLACDRWQDPAPVAEPS